MPTPENLILREMLARESGWVSGVALASKLGMSRVAVWHHMEKLRAEGFEFEASGPWDTGSCRARRAPCGADRDAAQGPASGVPLSVLDEVDSTNDEAARQLAEGKAAPFAVFARRQTRGRGRFGRVWHSEFTGNLYASFAFRPEVPPERMQTFTLWMGLNICELIANFARLRPGLKWPNDIVFDGRKAGGMLTEARVDADRIRDLIFGLGLNVNGPAGGWPADLGPKRRLPERACGRDA